MSDMKQQLIEIATEATQKAGVQAVTMRELGDAVGIKSSSVMYHFKNKNGLLQEIATSYTGIFFGRLKEIEANNPDPGSRIQRLVDLFEQALKGERMCLCGMLAADSSQLDDATKSTVRHFFKRMEHWVSDRLSEAGAEKQFAPLIVSSLEGAMLLDKLDGQLKRLRTVRRWLVTLFET